MSALYRILLLFALAIGAQQGVCQSFVYVEPGIASCPAAPASTAAAPKTVRRGAPVSGSISVPCGFDQGSYTVTLNSTDPSATFSPKTFLVNFGRIVGSGSFTVRFSTVGVHSVSAAITSNMGSPAVRGHFASAANAFNVVNPYSGNLGERLGATVPSAGDLTVNDDEFRLSTGAQSGPPFGVQI